MCMELLRMIAGEQLPFTIADRALIDKLRVLDAAGYVKAFIPAAHVDCDNCARQDPVKVIEITSRGRKAMTQRIERDLEAANVQRAAPRLPQEEPSRGAHLVCWHGGRRFRSGGYGPSRG